MSQQKVSQQKAYLRYKDLVAMGVVSNRMSLKRWTERPDDPFPAGIPIGQNVLVWSAEEIQKWILRCKSRKRRPFSLRNPRPGHRKDSVRA
jgi:predicted DNA-binding transcriptional regulator AlpA